MSTYRSMIDEALASAKARTTPVSTEKVASALVADPMVKQASELANALEYLSISAANDGTPAGSARQSVIRDFFKTSAAGVAPAQSEAPQGSQKVMPQQGKAKLSVPAKGSTPEVTDAPNGEKMLESFKQAENSGLSLYEILMNSKEAAGGGPAELSADQDAPGVPSANENANRQSLLGSNEAPVSATKREAKAPTRQRLAEAFAHSGDTTSSTVSGVFPQAAAKGGLKVADYADLNDLMVSGQLGEDLQAYALSVAGEDTSEKRASVGEYQELLTAIDNGSFGEEAKLALTGTLSVLEGTDKTASVTSDSIPNVDPHRDSEERLNHLLRR